MKAAEDWIVERQLKQVDGVLDVTSFGGLTKQYQVDIDPYRLRGPRATLPQVVAALAERQPERRGATSFRSASRPSTSGASG